MSVKQSGQGGRNRHPNHLSRRDVLILGGGAAAVSSTLFTSLAQATAETTQHGLSAFGDLGYPADFKQLKYVNASAPKGGMFSQLAGGGTATFNSLNGFILKGDPAVDMELVFCSLMGRAADEPDAVYAYAADQVTVSADGRVYKFRLRDGIKFHDGSPITAEDVAFSLTTLKAKGHPNIQMLLREMEAAEADGARTVVVRFTANRARSAPLTAANLPILSKAYYSSRAFDETTLDPPSAPAPTRSASSSRAASSNSSASRIGGAPSCRSIAASTISMCCVTTISATVTRHSRVSAPGAICSARNSPHASGPPSTTSRRSATGASSAKPSPTSAPPAPRAG